MTWKNLLLTTGVITAGLISGRAQTDVLFDSLGSPTYGLPVSSFTIPGFSDFGFDFPPELVYNAQSMGFVNPVDGDRGTDVTVTMVNDFGGGDLALVLLDSNGSGAPGNPLVAFTGNTNPHSSGNYNFTANSAYTLTGGNTYFIELIDYNHGTTQEEYTWNESSVNSGTAAGSWSEYNPGGSWYFNPFVTTSMQVNGLAVAPEPGTLSCLALGGIALLKARRRKA